MRSSVFTGGLAVAAGLAMAATDPARESAGVTFAEEPPEDSRRRYAVPDYGRKPNGSIADHPHEHSREIARRRRQEARKAAKAK